MRAPARTMEELFGDDKRLWPANPRKDLFTTMSYKAQRNYKSRQWKHLKKTPEDIEAERKKKALKEKTRKKGQRDKEKEEKEEKKRLEDLENADRLLVAMETARMVLAVDLRHRVLRHHSDLYCIHAARSPAETSFAVEPASPPQQHDQQQQTSRRGTPIAPALTDETVARACHELTLAGIVRPATDAEGVVTQLLEVLDELKIMAANQAVNNARAAAARARNPPRRPRPASGRSSPAQIVPDLLSSHACFGNNYDTPPQSDDEGKLETPTATATAAVSAQYTCSR